MNKERKNQEWFQKLQAETAYQPQPRNISQAVFSEHLWGIKDKEEFIYNPDKDSMADFLDSNGYPVAGHIYYCDTRIDYYLDGSRKIVTLDDPDCRTGSWTYAFSHDWHPGYTRFILEGYDRCYRMPKYSRWIDKDNIVNYKTICQLFPNNSYLNTLIRKYPYLKSCGRFWVAEDYSSFELAMEIDGNYRCFNVQGFMHRLEVPRFKAPYFPADINLRKRLAQYCAQISADMFNPCNKLLVLEHPTKGNKIIQCGYYLSYQTIVKILTDYNQPLSTLNKCMVENQKSESLYLTADCNVYSTDSELRGYVRSQDRRNIEDATPVYIIPFNILQSWAKDLTPEELKIINRERYYKYILPEQKLLNNELMMYSEECRTFRSKEDILMERRFRLSQIRKEFAPPTAEEMAKAEALYQAYTHAREGKEPDNPIASSKEQEEPEYSFGEIVYFGSLILGIILVLGVFIYVCNEIMKII